MNARSRYRIDDEPQPGTLAKFAVSPLWPLLGLMMGGAWLGLPWFLFNSIAVGSPTRVRETALVAVSLVGSVLIGLLLIWLVRSGFIGSHAGVEYALLVLLIWKLAIGYVLYIQQNATVELYQYYGGVLNKFGLLVVLAGAFYVRKLVLGAVPAQLWYLVMS